ncbi:hypothetical protein RBB50_012662 [Rhinocladiella similis]
MAESQRIPYCFEVRIVGNNTNTTPAIIVPFSEARDRTQLWNETVDGVPFWSDHRFLNSAPNEGPNAPIILLQETSTSRHKLEHNRWKTINWDEASEYTKWWQSNVVEGDGESLKIEIHFLTAPIEDYWDIYNQLTAVGKDINTMQDKSLVEIPFNADMGNLQNVRVVAGTNQWFPRRDIDVLTNANDCERCEVKAVELGLKKPSRRGKKAKKARERGGMEDDAEANEGGEGDVEMGDAGAGWTMNMTQRFRDERRGSNEGCQWRERMSDFIASDQSFSIPSAKKISTETNSFKHQASYVCAEN